MQEDFEREGMRGDLQFGTHYGIIEHGATTWPDAPAIEDGETTITFDELRQRVRDSARAMIAAGIEAGDRIAIWAPNIHEWILAALGAQAVGAIVVTVNTRYKGAEAAWLLNKSGAKALFSVRGFLDTDYFELLDRCGEPTDTVQHRVVLRGDAANHTGWADFLDAGGSISDADLDARIAAVSPDQTADIIFTSGTTGNPKGVMCSHAQNLRAFRDWAEVTGLRAGDRYLIVLPFFHSFGYKAGILASLMMGATILPEPVFDVDRVLTRIERDRISVLPGPPALYQSILAREDLEQHDLSSLRLAVTGAAAIPVSLIHEMRDRLHFDTIITGYGLTEATGVVTMCRYNDDPETIATTSGRAVPGVEVAIFDDDNNPLPANTPGEVVVRGYNVMQGYFADPEQTAETIDGDGWLHTGDIGVLDERGYIRITDRKKDMFIVGGFNAYPAEIENLMARHPAIAQVAVVGMPDKRMGEVGCAFVVPREGATVDEAELIAWCREQMANYKVPRRVIVVDALPTNATGKVLKYELRDRARELVTDA
ncbi:MAG: fatty acid--CoA ligase family protein [Candidatus Dadabacteria bacterium]|nr:MAG: fatty acid--CoA ligase family protein [Candidatus Dadabacteria bacterium]